MSKGEPGTIAIIDFKLTSLFFKIRDAFHSPLEPLRKIGIVVGQTVLDYGCGGGSHSIPAAMIVGDGGRVYALDKNPLAVQAVERKAAKEGLRNVTVIRSDRDTGLPDSTVDVALLFDTIHLIKDKEALLAELHRVIKPGGVLAVLVEHLQAEDVASYIEGLGKFKTAQAYERMLVLSKA